MPPPSEASQRYNIIDNCLINIYNRHPSLDDLRNAIYKELGTEVSRETVQKDIAFMKKSIKEGGFEAPILFKKAYNGYCYDPKFPEFTIRQFGFNQKSLEIMELAAGVLQRFQGVMASDSYNHALNKLYSALNIEKTSKDKNLINAILPQETTYLRGMEHFQVLVDGIKLKKPISFIHYSYDKKLFKAIIIHPYLLKESNERWYLVGYSESEDHKEIRYFGVDRIYDPVLIDKLFIENNGNDLRSLFDNKIGLNTIKDKAIEVPETITLWVSKIMANYIKSMPIHKSQDYKYVHGNGEIVVTLNLVPTKELVALILSYGKHMELLTPVWLRKEIEKELERTVIRYKRNIKNE
jgi:predicted DNA-binding transcriptional regulator YafY